ncbi:MAG: hypothetical protein U0Q16_05070 [Bryobacteraceae bacterium]
MTKLLAVIALVQGAERRLTIPEARMLAENSPDFLNSRVRGGCPRTELLWTAREYVVVQIRNRCPKTGSGMIGNYRVALRTGEITVDADTGEEIDSERLSLLRKKLLSKHK